MQKKQNYILWSLIIISLISIIPLFALAQYAHPSSDDYAYSLTTYEMWKSSRNIFLVIKEAAATSVRYWYKWQGLYSSAFLLALQPGIFGEQYYIITGFIILGIVCFGNLVLSYYILRYRLKESRLFAVAMGAVLSGFMLNWFPSMEDGVYWYNGAMNYTFFMGILLIAFCIIVDLCKEQSKISVVIKTICAIGFTVALSGGNHITGFAGILLSVGILVFQLILKNKIYAKRIFLILVPQLAGFAVNLLSPGTSRRQSALGGSKGLLLSIWNSVTCVLERFERWTGLELIVCMVILLPFFWQSVKRIREEFHFSFSYPLLVFFGSVAFLSAMIFPAFYAMGTYGTSRTLNMLYIMFIILVFVNEYYICGWLRGKLQGMEVTWSNYWMLTTALLLFGTFWGSYETTLGYEAYECIRSGQAAVYSSEADARYNLLIRSEGQDVEVSAYSVYPRLLIEADDDVTVDPEAVKNQQVKKFYNLNSIVRKTD